MNEIDALRTTSQLITAFHTIKSNYEQSGQDISYFEHEYNDLTHALELINFNAVDGYKLAKQLQQNRVNRRYAKDQNHQLQPLYELVMKHQAFFNDLRRVQTQIEKIRSAQQSRTYTPRARTDMQEAFNRAAKSN